MTDRSTPPRDAPPTPVQPRAAVQRWRLVLARDAPGPAPSRDPQAAWDAVLVACGLPVVGLDLPVPRPRFVVAAPLPNGVPGEAELADLWLTERLPRWRVREALEGRLPVGHRLVDLRDAWLGEGALPGLVAASAYRAVIAQGGPAPGAVREAAAAIVAATSLPRRRPKGDTTVEYDLRPFIDDLRLEPVATGHVLRMTLRHDPERGIGRPEEVLAELGERVGTPIPVDALVRERIVLRDHSPDPPPRTGPPGRGRR